MPFCFLHVLKCINDYKCIYSEYLIAMCKAIIKTFVLIRHVFFSWKDADSQDYACVGNSENIARKWEMAYYFRAFSFSCNIFGSLAAEALKQTKVRKGLNCTITVLHTVK